MQEVKSPKSIDEQIAILRKRGCEISNTGLAREVLSKTNYYRLSAYFLPFKDPYGTYISGTTFERVFHIYEFDRKIRTLLFCAIERIETALRAHLAYMHGMKYGALGYRDPENFDFKSDYKFGKLIKSKEEKEKEFQKTINRVILNNKNNLFVKHHNENYGGQFPIWVIIELFTFGMLSKFFSHLHTQDKKVIARQYHTSYKILGSWLRCCTDLRNICAHGGRLYYRIFSAAPSGFILQEKVSRSLWASMLVIKALYPFPDQWREDFISQIKGLINKYLNDIDLKHLYFPENWEEELGNN